MARRARILHVLKIYRPMFTGEGVFLERCSAVMQELAPHIEHDVLVTNMPRPAHQPAVCSTLQRIFHLTRRPLGTWRHEAALVWWFIRHLHRYDTVHIRVHADWYFLTYILAKLTRRRLILSATLDDSVPNVVSHYRRELRATALRLFRLFDGFVSISPKLHQETSSVMDPAKCHLVPCGIEILPPDPARGQQVRAQLGIPADAFVVIFLGGLCERKDPALLVRQLPALLRHRPDSYVLLVGPTLEPAYVAAMRALIRDSGVDARVIFAGEAMDPHPYFDAADIMAFGSRLEGFGTVVPEAMAHALPVVVRHLPGVNDLFVKHGETGFFFDDDEGYLEALLRLAGDAALRRTIGRNARLLVQQSFDMRRVASTYLAIYGFPVAEPAPVADATVADATADLAAARAARIGTTASVVNPRFHAKAQFDAAAQPMLLTMIDAEEAFDWSLPFSRAATDVTSMAAQYLAHRIFERYRAVPLYAVDYPVATQDAGIAPLRELVQDGLCDIGAQVHPWVTPPFVEEVSPRNSYPGSLPLRLEYSKLRRLTASIEDAFGIRPRLHRAGRYGAGPRTGDVLKALGYEADSSVMPNWDFSNQQGPDFTAISATPYWIDEDRSILEIPGAAAMVGLLSSLGEPARRAIQSGPSEWLSLPSLTARLGLLERIKLTPEGITVTEAKRLVRHMMAHGHKVFVLTYHTPSLVPGNTPYVHTQHDLDRFLAWLDEFFDFFTREIGGRCAGWREVRAAAGGPPATPAPARKTLAAAQ